MKVLIVTMTMMFSLGLFAGNSVKKETCNNSSSQISLNGDTKYQENKVESTKDKGTRATGN